MKVTYDPEVDSMYIILSDSSKDKQQELTEDIILDMDSKGSLVGIEILDATKNYGRGILEFNLSLLGEPTIQPRYDYSADEAAQALRVNKETILRKIRTGDLKATRIGKSYRIPKNELRKLMIP